LQSFEGAPDKRLRETLMNELPGILNWALDGLRAWLRDGLGSCATVQEATNHYQRESDQVGRWIEECCIVAHDAEMSTKDGYKSYTSWCDESNERALSQNMWGRRMLEKGHERTREGYKRLYLGIGLSTTHDTHDALIRDSPCENEIQKSSDQCVMCVMEEDHPGTTPPVGRDQGDAIERRAQRMVEEALDKAARILADPTKPVESARMCVREVPGAYEQATLARIEEMIAEQLGIGGA
jgi:phage/plasmid-associated DNA primase